MNRIDQIRERLASLAPISLDIEDESHLHAGHAGARSGGGHFRLRMVSDCFRGHGTLARHRMIYAALGDMMQGPIHALAIKALTADEADHPTTP
ncbi:MAG: BolA family transcriptional regulator [Pseudazoarcus pumilus]|nr:BolA family transcriptional regulator [Pseudazoarcus pumilus]